MKGIIGWCEQERREEFEVDRDKNSLIFQLAEAIASIEQIEIDHMAKILEILPAESADRALSYAKIIDDDKRKAINAVDDKLCEVYAKRFKSLLDSGKLKQLTTFNKKAIKDYTTFKCRLFDMTERIMIIEYFKINPLEVAGRYNGSDPLKIALNDIRKSYNRQDEKSDGVLNDIIVPLIEKVISEIKASAVKPE